MANPNSQEQFLTAQDASADFESPVIIVKSADRAYIQLNVVSGAPQGVLKIQGSSDPNPLGEFPDLEDASITCDGVKTSYAFNLSDLAMPYIRVAFVHSSGTGSFDGFWNIVDDQ